MAPPPPIHTIPTLSLILLFLILFLHRSQPTTAALVEQQPLVLKYHNGALLKGNIPVNLIWYGKFTPAQRSIVVDFLTSLGAKSKSRAPSVSSWWSTTEKYKGGGPSTLTVRRQTLLENYPFGKTLTNTHLLGLASRPNTIGSINVVLTAQDVSVDGFCMRCGSHGASGGRAGKGAGRSAYIWVGNSNTQCPGQCAWPFHQPIYGPQTPALVAPNGDVGIDGMIINLATLLAGTVTNPYSNGYFQGPADAPLEAVSACTGIFGKGAYPGYPGQVMVDKASGASFNAFGVNGRKFLLPAMWDPRTSACSTLV